MDDSERYTNQNNPNVNRKAMGFEGRGTGGRENKEQNSNSPKNTPHNFTPKSSNKPKNSNRIKGSILKNKGQYNKHSPFSSLPSNSESSNKGTLISEESQSKKSWKREP